MSANPERFRYQISNQIPDHPFTDYWDVFVLKHQHPWNIACHLAGLGVIGGFMIAAVWCGNGWWLLAAPLGQLLGLLGHRLFEPSHIDRQDAIFSWRATLCLGRLLWRVLIGQYGTDLRCRREQLQQYLSRQDLSSQTNGFHSD
jgi:hypothetical protein